MQRSQTKVLLVDDDEEDQIVIRGMLEEAPKGTFHLDWVSLLVDAKKALSRGRFDVCLLDYHLGEHNGLELLRDAVTHGCRPPLIMLTGQGDRDVDVQAMQMGAADYLDKRHLTGALLERSIRYAIERKHVALALQASEERYALAVHGANDGLWDWNLETNEVFYSPRWKAILGHEADEIGNSQEEWFDRVHPDDVRRLRTRLEQHLQRKTPHFDGEYRIRHKDQTYRWVLSRGVAVYTRRGRATRIAGSLTDITARKSAEERLIHDTLHDALTGLPNRTLFIDRLSQVVKQRARHPESTLAVFFIDLDGFKLINDRLGHLQADKCLVELAHRLESCVRPTDTISRFGGDEFALLATDIRGEKEAEVFVERIQRAISRPMLIANHEVTTTASVGIVMGGASGDDTEHLLRKADRAMYLAKERGRGSYAIYDENAHVDNVEWPDLVSDLKKALEERQLQLHYQPIMCLKSHNILGFEAFARWLHPRSGPISPSKFIPIAERAGLSADLTRWVLREACRQVVSWQGEVSANSPFSISVRVPPRELQRRVIIDDVASVLADTAIDPSRLALELAENEFMEQPDSSVLTLEKIAALGVQIHISGFGVGYSSLGRLANLPVTALKIDRSFVHRLDSGNGDAKIVRAIVTLARDLNLQTVAEGIENRSQFELISRELGFDRGQGFYIAPPVDPDAAAQLLEAHAKWGPRWEEESLKGEFACPSAAHA